MSRARFSISASLLILSAFFSFSTTAVAVDSFTEELAEESFNFGIRSTDLKTEIGFVCLAGRYFSGHACREGKFALKRDGKIVAKSSRHYTSLFTPSFGESDLLQVRAWFQQHHNLPANHVVDVYSTLKMISTYDYDPLQLMRIRAESRLFNQSKYGSVVQHASNRYVSELVLVMDRSLNLEWRSTEARAEIIPATEKKFSFDVKKSVPVFGMGIESNETGRVLQLICLDREPNSLKDCKRAQFAITQSEGNYRAFGPELNIQDRGATSVEEALKAKLAERFDLSYVFDVLWEQINDGQKTLITKISKVKILPPEISDLNPFLDSKLISMFSDRSSSLWQFKSKSVSEARFDQVLVALGASFLVNEKKAKNPKCILNSVRMMIPAGATARDYADSLGLTSPSQNLGLNPEEETLLLSPAIGTLVRMQLEKYFEYRPGGSGINLELMPYVSESFQWVSGKKQAHLMSKCLQYNDVKSYGQLLHLNGQKNRYWESFCMKKPISSGNIEGVAYKLAKAYGCAE